MVSPLDRFDYGLRPARKPRLMAIDLQLSQAKRSPFSGPEPRPVYQSERYLSAIYGKLIIQGGETNNERHLLLGTVDKAAEDWTLAKVRQAKQNECIRRIIRKATEVTCTLIIS